VICMIAPMARLSIALRFVNPKQIVARARRSS
jgi:hypothetical protein